MCPASPHSRNLCSHGACPRPVAGVILGRPLYSGGLDLLRPPTFCGGVPAACFFLFFPSFAPPSRSTTRRPQHGSEAERLAGGVLGPPATHGFCRVYGGMGGWAGGVLSPPSTHGLGRGEALYNRGPGAEPPAADTPRGRETHAIEQRRGRVGDGERMRRVPSPGSVCSDKRGRVGEHDAKGGGVGSTRAAIHTQESFWPAAWTYSNWALQARIWAKPMCEGSTLRPPNLWPAPAQAWAIPGQLCWGN